MEAPTNSDLETAIEQLVKLGEKDPLSIARKLIAQNGETWARLEVAARAEEFITDLARKKVRSVKPSTAVVPKFMPGREITASQLRIMRVWLPGFGYKIAAELTASDLRKRADFYGVIVNTAHQRESWYREAASLMEAEGAQFLGELKAELPVLPDSEELLQLGAAS